VSGGTGSVAQSVETKVIVDGAHVACQLAEILKFMNHVQVVSATHQVSLLWILPYNA
jgi:hypothetical protein